MLKLTYHIGPINFVTVIGSPCGIRDLYWQLTHNYTAQDGRKITEINVTNLDGKDCTDEVLHNPHLYSTRLGYTE